MDPLQQVESVYNGLRLTEASQAMIGLATLVAVFAVVNKFIKAYKEAFSDGDKPAGVKHFFNLFYVYIYCVVAIALAPVLFRLVEQSLGEFQSEMVGRYSGYLNSSIMEAMKEYAIEYETEIQEAGFFDIEAAFMRLTTMLSMQLYALGMACHKYVYYMFVAGRYLYLLLLQMIAPFAVYAWLDDSTRHYTQGFLKNLFICYMMIPAFLIAGTFSDELAKNLSSFLGMESEMNLVVVFLSLVFKFFLLGKAAGYVRQLI